MPQAMFTFLEEYDFAGKTVIPFTTQIGKWIKKLGNKKQRKDRDLEYQ